jgi:DNA invertase Pin-like site-specific DNA recombinase
MLGVFAEFETNLRRERQTEGVAAAKVRGVYEGRKPAAPQSTGCLAPGGRWYSAPTVRQKTALTRPGESERRHCPVERIGVK